MIGSNRNLWSQFVAVAGAGSYRTVGECIAADFGTCTIQLPGGSEIQALGAGTVGLHYFVKDGKLDGEAPALDLLEIEI